MKRLNKLKFKKIVQKLTVVPVITGEEKLVDDLYIDSLSIISLIVNIEKNYNIYLPDDLLSVNHSVTVNELFELINSKGG